MCIRDRAAGAVDRIKFVGFVKGAEKDALIDGAACIACPSTWYENMPNAVLEAYAHGKPAVVFTVGCMPEIVEDGETGAVVPFGDTGALGRAVARYAGDSELSRLHGGNGRALANDRYTARKHLEALTGILQPGGERGDR